MASRITKVSDETKGRNVLLFDADGYPIYASPSGGFISSAPDFAEKYLIVGKKIYIAYATIGSIEADAVWQASVYDTTDKLDITHKWADGNNLFDNIATDLSLLSYS